MCFEFKIQYGEIYSASVPSTVAKIPLFKIQYGEIYSKIDAYQPDVCINLKSSMERFIDRYRQMHCVEVGI